MTDGPDPDQVSVEKIQLSNISVVEVINLRCTALDVYPGVTFTWNVPCLNTTRNKESSDCTYHLAPEDNGKTVECTATNNITNISQSSSYTLTYTVVVTRECRLYKTSNINTLFFIFDVKSLHVSQS